MKKLAPVLIGLFLAGLVALVLWPEPEAPPEAGPRGAQRSPTGTASPDLGPGATLGGTPSNGEDAAPTDDAGPLLSPAEEAPQAGPSGSVQDLDGRPLPNASVWIAGPDASPRAFLARTGLDGRFPWPPRDELLLVSAEGFAPSLVPPGPPRVVALERARALEGRVVDAASGEGLPEAFVQASRGDYQEVVTTNAVGRFELSAPQGPVELLVWADDHVSARFSESDLPSLSLERGAGLSGRLLLPGDEAPGDATVWIVDADNLNRVHRTAARSDGTFELASGISGETVWILAGNDRFATSLTPRWLDAKRECLVDLSPRGSLLLEVSGPPLDRPPMLSPTSLPEEVLLNALGPAAHEAGWVYAGLAPGSYQLMTPSGPLADLEIQPDQQARLPWAHIAPRAHESAPGGAALRVRVTDRQGVALEGAQVVARGEAAEQSATTDARGEAELDLPAGAVTVTASARGRVLLAPVSRDGDDRSEATLVLAQACVLYGQVFPNERAEVTLLRGEDEERSEHSDDAGRFRMEEIAAGPYTLLIGTETKTPVRLEVQLPLDRPLHVHLEQDYGECDHEGHGHE